MVDIHFVKASDYCESVVDGTHDSPKPCDEGFYLITSKHLLDYEINFARTDAPEIEQRTTI